MTGSISLPRSNRTCGVLLGLVLGLLIVAAYLPALRGDFLWDDDSHVSANPVIVGPQGLKEIWTTAAANYFPLVLTNFWVQHACWGLNPLGYHLTTLLFHLLTALTLWRVLARLGIPGAWFGAALWALHPVQVESVAWICELKNTQSALFYLLAIGFFIRWLEAGDRLPPAPGKSRANPAGMPPTGADRGRTFYALALLCALAALLSKPSTVMLPVALGLCVWWRRGNFGARDLSPLTPFLFLSAIVSGWTIWEQKFHSAALGSEWNQSLPERLIIAGRALWFYLGKLAWPEPLVFIYPRWQLEAGRPLAYFAPGAALAMVAVMFWQRARLRPLFLAGIYFGALLFPVLGFFNVYFFRYSFVGDHFQYLASMGPLALLAAGLTLAAGRARVTVAGVVLAALATLSFQQSRMYRDGENLYRTILARNPDCWLAHNNLGELMEQRGDEKAAVAHYETAIRLNPAFAEAHNNVGAWLSKQPGRLPEALVHYETALRLNPALPQVHNNLAVQLAKIPGRLPEALARYEQALRLKPGYGEVHYNLGIELARQPDRLSEAVEHFEQALRINPNHAEAHAGLASALARLPHRVDDGIAHYERAIQLKRDYAEAHNNLANELAKLSGRMPDALAHYERAVQINPNFSAAHYNFANKLAKLPGRSAEAVEHYQNAVQADPNFAAAHFSLGNELAKLPDRQQEAIASYEAALRLEPKSVAARKALAVVLARTGRVDAAIRQLEGVLADQPDDEGIRTALAELKSQRQP